MQDANPFTKLDDDIYKELHVISNAHLDLPEDLIRLLILEHCIQLEQKPFSNHEFDMSKIPPSGIYNTGRVENFTIDLPILEWWIPGPRFIRPLAARFPPNSRYIEVPFSSLNN